MSDLLEAVGVPAHYIRTIRELPEKERKLLIPVFETWGVSCLRERKRMLDWLGTARMRQLKGET